MGFGVRGAMELTVDWRESTNFVRTEKLSLNIAVISFIISVSEW